MMNLTAKPSNSTAKVPNSTANRTKSTAKVTNSIAKTCYIILLNFIYLLHNGHKKAALQVFFFKKTIYIAREIQKY